MTVNVWAEAPDTPGNVCDDARLGGGNGERGAPLFTYPNGSTRGQAGWNVGVHFRDLADLADKLAVVSKEHGRIARLAIHAHGDAHGVVFIEGQKRATHALTSDTVKQQSNNLKRIRDATTGQATILIMGCNAGLGYGGTLLLKKLSEVWTGRTVVAFTTIGVVEAALQERESEPGCTEPGMRDQGSSSPTLKQVKPAGYLKSWNNLDAMPWQSERSRSAKAARNGEITKGSTDEGPKRQAMPWWLDKKLADAWTAYAQARVMGSPADSLRRRFMQIMAERDRKNIEYTGNYGPKSDGPPWKFEEDALSKTPRPPPPMRRGTGKPAHPR